MRKLTALAAGMTLAMTAMPAAAGVVITQKQHVTSGTNTRDTEQTISVQGNKQKMVTERHTIITDLDAGKMYVLDPKAKSYFEIEFPPKGQMATMMAASTNAAMNFKRAGDYTVKECFSTSAPGAAEFQAFEKNMADKLKNSGTPTGNGEMPGGVPLALDSTMKMGKVNIPGMAADQAAKINEMMAKRPPVTTSTVVEKIESKRLAEADFAVPTDYTKRDLPGPGSMMMRPGAMKMPPPGGAPGAGASPATH